MGDKNKRKQEESGRLDTGKISQDSNPSTFSRSGSDMASKRQSVYIRTFGCQMNARDSEALLGLFLGKGCSVAENVEEADVILVNTCSVRKHAEDRAISYLGSLKKIAYSGKRIADRKEKRNTHDAIRDMKIIGLIGCMAVNRGEEIFKKMPHISLICGPASFDKIPDYVNRITDAIRNTHDARQRRIINITDKTRGEGFYRACFREESNHAQIVISTGCSNYCSYCIVPYVRGELRLRNPEDIIDEVKRNIKLGIRKITLLGQNVNDYNYQRIADSGKRLVERDTHDAIRNTEINFVDLLRMIVEIEGIEEIDFISSQPRNISKELFTLMAESSKIRKHLHLPFQSGSDRILKLMKRGYTQQEYLAIVDNYKKVVGGSLSTDIIVGFPTESQDDFNRTKDILERVKFSCAYIFKYSPRNAAKSIELIDDVSEETKVRRHKILLDLQKSISKKII